MGDALGKQWGIETAEGVIMADVKSESLAERWGIPTNDIMIKINGKVKPTRDRAFLQPAALASGEGSHRESLRRGTHETIKIELR